MSISSLGGVLKIFGGTDPTPEEQAQLAKEVMLMTLARATAADTNIKKVEVEKVREVLQARTGEDFPAVDVQVARPLIYLRKGPSGEIPGVVRQETGRRRPPWHCPGTGRRDQCGWPGQR